MGNNIFEVMERNKFSYKAIREKSIVSLLNENEYTINVIIGFRDRQQFYEAITESFEQAFKYYLNKFPEREHFFCLTFVEHSEKPEGQKFFEGRTNYIWSSGPDWNKLYNRSFSYNIGVLWGNKAGYYLLHDLDVVVKKTFFEDLFKDLMNFNYPKAFQPYGKRRILYLNEELTQKVLNKEIDYNTFSENTPGVTPPKIDPAILNSKGGSLLLSRELYYDSGAMPANTYSGYAAEDQQFFAQLETLCEEVVLATNNDIFHLNHPVSHFSNPEVHDMDDRFRQFKEMNKPSRMQVINILKQQFLQ